MKKKTMYISLFLVFMFLFMPSVYAEGTTRMCTACGGAVKDIPVQLPEFIRNVVFALQLLVPVILVLWGIFDFMKAVIASDEKAMKDSQNRFIKRIIASVLIFFVVAIVKFAFSLIPGDTNYLGCVPCFISDKDSCEESYVCPERKGNNETQDSTTGTSQSSSNTSTTTTTQTTSSTKKCYVCNNGERKFQENNPLGLCSIREGVTSDSECQNQYACYIAKNGTIRWGVGLESTFGRENDTYTIDVFAVSETDCQSRRRCWRCSNPSSTHWTVTWPTSTTSTTCEVLATRSMDACRG